MGDLGGTKELIISLVAVFITPISEFAFLLSAFRNLYTARTATSGLFKNSPHSHSKSFPTEYKNTVVDKTLSSMYSIRIQPYYILKVFCY